MHLHFLRAIGIAMSMRAGVAADAAAALLFRILSQPALLFPPLSQVEGVEILHEPTGGYSSNYRKQVWRSSHSCLILFSPVYQLISKMCFGTRLFKFPRLTSL